MFRHFKGQDRGECIERMRRLNYNLNMLVNGAQLIAPAETNIPPKNVARHCERVREHAIILYRALQDMVQTTRCSCDVCTLPNTHSNT